MNPINNQYGVPHKCYSITIADDERTTHIVDVGDESDWGDIQQMSIDDKFEDSVAPVDWFERVGWGNDADGHIEIVRVVDLDTGKTIPVQKWAKECVWCYASNYSG